MSIYTLEQDGDVGELRRLLANSDSPAVRKRATEALGEVASADDEIEDDVTGVLIEVAIEDGEAAVRAGAIDAIDTIGGDARRQLFARLDGVDVVPGEELPVSALVDAMAHDMPEVRMAAANAIGHEGTIEAVPALLEGFRDPDPRVRLRVARAAGRIGDPRAVEALSSLAAGAPTPFRQVVATALGEIGGEAALDAISPLLVDDEDEVRRDAVLALGMFERCQPVERLVERLTDDAEEIRRAAAFGIVDLLSNVPAEDSHDLRSAVIEALSTSHEGPVVEALIELFEDSTEAHRRRNAVWLLGRVSDDRDATVETLVAALDDDDEMVRRFAATSLVEIDTPAVEEALLDALDTTFGEGRAMIIFVLGKVGTERARQRLLTLMDEIEDLEAQERALAALSRLGGT